MCLADLNSLAMRLDATGRSIEAEPLLRRALAGREKVLGPDDPDVADTLVNLITLLRRQGRFAEAAKIVERPLQIYRAALGRTHASVVPGLLIVATIHQDRAEFAEAEELFVEALRIRQAAYGAEHAYVGKSYLDLVRLSLARRQIEEAEAIHRRQSPSTKSGMAPMTRTSCGPFATSPSSACSPTNSSWRRHCSNAPLPFASESTAPTRRRSRSSASDLAGLHQLRGKLGDAERYYERPLAIYRKQLGIAASVGRLRARDARQPRHRVGQSREAERRYDEAREISVAAYGKASPVQNFILNNKALLLVQLRRFDEAERLFQAGDRSAPSWRRRRYLGARECLVQFGRSVRRPRTPGRSGEAREASRRHHQQDLRPGSGASLVAYGEIAAAGAGNLTYAGALMPARWMISPQRTASDLISASSSSASSASPTG